MDRTPLDNGDSQTLRRYFEVLLAHFGPQGWWPGRTRLEVILGAILTQNTAWRNAALALQRLRRAGLLNLGQLRSTSLAKLARLVRPAGFYRQKARAIRCFLDWLDRAYGSSLARVFRAPPRRLRDELLALQGVGPETADAILLYAGGQPFFVADAYTRRILARHGLGPSGAGYSAFQEYLHRSLPPDQALYNEFHALLVETGKQYCRREAPRCDICPLEPFLPSRRVRSGSGAPQSTVII